ncbi:MAG: MtnX-like HAD-IB family phosphatase [Thermodesulfobacteriota bacterium]|nr:MtnX-like HAD-IB family phosphatase [Thermodesulfobacteriota bacterium]
MTSDNSNPAFKKLVLCDFDGTITEEDVGYNFLNRFTHESWEDIDRDYVNGKIGSKEAYTRIARIISGAQDEMVDFVCNESVLDHYFIDFYEFCKKKSIDLKVVSDGFGLYIDALLNRHNIGGIEYFANGIIFKRDKGIDIEFPFHDPDCGSCGNCKRKILKRFQDQYDDIIFVGNGLSDRCIAEEADEVYAKSDLYSHCVENNIECWNYNNFGDIKRNMEKGIKGVIFDLDGTLIDSVRPILDCFNYTLEHFGDQRVSADEISALSRRSIQDVMNQLVGSRNLHTAMKLFKGRYIDLIVNSPPLFGEVKKVLSYLNNSGILLGIATNMDGKNAKKILRISDIEEYFTTVVGADDSGKPKPHPEMIFKALHEMNVSTEEAVFVGDSVIDIETGKNAMVDVYAVPTGFDTKKGLSEKRPRRILNRLNDLLKIVKDNNFQEE